METIGPEDILQGDCGNCYFLSSIASLAEFPDRIRQIFRVKAINNAGCYAVELFINGEPKVVVVDDRFPFCEYKN